MKGTALALALAGLLLGAVAIAQSPQEKGRAIAEEADRRDSGWHDNVSTMKMILRNQHGGESERLMRRQALETTAAGRGDKNILVFDAPTDIKGTALLTHTKVLEPGDQWLFLPALKRVKRISSVNKSGPFVGSEFAFEDLVSQEVDKYTYRWLRDEVLEGMATFVVERVPRYEHSGYARQVVWYDTQEYRIQRIDFYDRKDTPLKTLRYSGYRQYGGKYWRPDVMHMVNQQNGKSTDISVEAWEFQAGLSDPMFTPTRLKRVS